MIYLSGEEKFGHREINSVPDLSEICMETDTNSVVGRHLRSNILSRTFQPASTQDCLQEQIIDGENWPYRSAPCHSVLISAANFVLKNFVSP